MAGTSGAAVTKACKSKLADALVGEMIDIGHPVAEEYLKKNRGKATKSTNGGKATSRARGSRRDTKRASAQTPENLDPTLKQPKLKGPAAVRERKKRQAAEQGPPGNNPIPEHLSPYVDLTLRELITRFGTDYQFVEWLKAINLIEGIQEKRLKNLKTQGELIHRQLVEDYLISPINTAHTQMLADGAKTLAAKAIELRDSGDGAVEIEKEIRDRLSSFIKPMKRKIKKALADV
jgi:hypothetical protein